MKDLVNTVFENILEDELVIKTNYKYNYEKDEICVVFIENSEYYQLLIDEEISNKYLFNHKGNKHLLLAVKDNFDKYPSLYSELVIKSTLRLFVNRRKSQKKLRALVFTLSLIVLLANVLIILSNEFSKIFFIPILSVIVVGLVFIYVSKLMSIIYRKEQSTTKEKLFEVFPNLEDEIISDKNQK